jgi:hypothetical protein
MVNPKALTITGTASPSTVAYPNSPTLDAAYNGFVNGESKSSLAGTLTLTVLTAANVPVNTPYPAGVLKVRPAGLTSSNYAITFVDGTFTVTNDKPVITTVTGPDPVPAAGNGASASVNVAFTDNGVSSDNYMISSVWTRSGGTSQSVDGVQVSYDGMKGTATITANGLVTGVYTVVVTVKDKFDATSDPYEYRYVVVYDPNGGFVTGGGWIDSQPGAYRLNTSLAGKANFGFVSKYQKGQTQPSGDTEFQFHAASMNFKSKAYEWLVLSGTTRAQFKGTGTINGSGNYAFLLSGIDGDNFGVRKPDMFRIKIWDVDTGAIVYDNNYGADELADPATTIAGGSIQIKAK